jgi:hypothetical protein
MKTPPNAAVAAALFSVWLALPACSSGSDGSPPGPMGPSMGIIEVDPNRIPLGEGGHAASGGSTGQGGAPVTAGSPGGGSDGGGKPLEKIGKPCETSADCPAGLNCRMDPDYVAHKQCTVSCGDDASCAAVEAGAFCIGAGVCVHGCKAQADCGPKTRCGSNDWCERTGPGSGVPYCGGLATPCFLLTDSTCYSSSGCHDDSRCSGVPDSCYSQFDSYSCGKLDGCFWNSSSKSCSGSANSCSGIHTRFSCEDQTGCTWHSECSGTARSCDETLTALCSTQQGCSLVTD